MACASLLLPAPAVVHQAFLPSSNFCRWFDLVVVLQTDNSILYERLEKR